MRFICLWKLAFDWSLITLYLRFYAKLYYNNHCVKVSVFGVILVRIYPHSDWILSISPYSVRMRENADQNNCNTENSSTIIPILHTTQLANWTSRPKNIQKHLFFFKEKFFGYSAHNLIAVTEQLLTENFSVDVSNFLFKTVFFLGITRSRSKFLK